jgi:hypothetical protein
VTIVIYPAFRGQDELKFENDMKKYLLLKAKCRLPMNMIFKVEVRRIKEKRWKIIPEEIPFSLRSFNPMVLYVSPGVFV